MTCRICTTEPVDYWGGTCPKCLPAYNHGVREGVNSVTKEIRNELQQIIRMMEQIDEKFK